MTEAEWLLCEDPDAMLPLTRDPGRYRKSLLFATACFERMAETTGHRNAGRARILNLAESRADGNFVDLEPHITASVMSNMRQSTSEQIYLELLLPSRSLDVRPIAQHTAEESSTCPFPRRVLTYTEERRAQANLLREIVGNPLRTIILDYSWLTSTVVFLATGIYDEHAFDRMPILADALQDAGCDSEEILNHCRQPGEHVRGCWVVDLVLGKT